MKSLWVVLKNLGTGFFEALFPPRCIVCRQEGSHLCDEHRKFPVAPANEAHFEFVDTIIARTAYYDPTAQKTVEYFKFHGFGELAEILAKEMRESIPKDWFTNSLFVPIPLHWTRKFWRGFNQAECIIEKLNADGKITVSTNLRRIRRTKQQAKLERVERISNLKDSFFWDTKHAPDLKKFDRVILIDDVVASGSTLDAAAKELKRNGAREVCAVVFARGGRDKNQ